MKAVQSKRRLEKGAITRAYTFIHNPPGELDAEHIEARLSRLEASWKELQIQTSELYNYEEQEGFVDPENEINEYEDKYLNCVGWFKRILKSFDHVASTPEPHLDMFSRLAEQHSTLLQRLDLPFASRNDDLPKIRIEPFSGNYKEWPAFKDLFISAVDSRPNLSSIQKYQYLKSLLKDDAANLIKHIQVSEGSYQTAWDRLKERFDRPRHIVTSYIETFMSLPSTREENVGMLRKISDTSNEVIRGLNAISCNERDHWLIHILQGKIDSESRQKWIEWSRDDIKPSLENFLKFLEQRCEELELGAKGFAKTAHVKRNASTSFVSTSSSQNCCDCGSLDHYINKCAHFLALTTDKCHSLVKKKNLCFNCLRKGHSVPGCKSQHKCRICQRGHHTLLHFEQKDRNQTAHVAALSGGSPSGIVSAEPQCSQPVSLSTVVSHASSELYGGKNLTHILPTAVVNVLNNQGQWTNCRLLLDTASELSYITEDCIKRLCISRIKSKLTLTGISSVKAESTHGHSFIKIKSRNSQRTLDAQVHILGRITASLPRSTITHVDRQRLDDVYLADPSFNRSTPIDILLGADYVWDVITQQKLFDHAGNTIAISTIFGWVVTSIISSHQNQLPSLSLITRVDIDKTLQLFWEIEEIGTATKQDDECTFVEKHFQETHDRHLDGRYIVQLPFKWGNPSFGDTLQGALARFNSTEQRLDKNPTLKEKYCTFMAEYHRLGHMREIPPEEINVSDGCLFYLPHHPIVGSKLRVVFDGSFQDKANTSLNDNLCVGPSIQRNLFAVCFRFRLHKHVFCADIVKMFRQIWVADSHRNYQRILWRENSEDILKHFQLCTVTYGTASAPYLAVKVLEQLAKDYAQSYPSASRILLDDFYVDDVLTGASTEGALIKKRNELVDLLARAGLQLSKWISNCKDICPDGEETPGFLRNDETDTTKVLGIYWNAHEDVIRYKIDIQTATFATKRKLISDVSRIFDPLGLISPVVVKFKILFQELWLLNLSWDEPLPDGLAKLWLRYREDLHNITSLQIPRYVPNQISKLALHGFCDASMKAYAAVVYSKMEDNEGNICVNLLASKTRVAPLKQISLPRLELCGALLLTRLMKTIIASLPHEEIEINAWCDSTVVLSWLSLQPTKLKTFVGNRTSAILETLPRNVWRHVNTKQNPADCASRGMMVNQLIELDLWWSGPSFLRLGMSSVNVHPELTNKDVMAEMKSSTGNVTTTLFTTGKLAEPYIHPLEQVISKVSHWYKLVRIAAYVQRFINLYVHRTEIPSKNLTFEEIKYGKTICLRMAQTKFFKQNRGYPQLQNINANAGLNQLSPFVDEEGLLRVGGRISNSGLPFETQHPVILPKHCRITLLILHEEHINNLHPGVSALLVIVRQKYWVLGARNLIRKLTHQCLKCFRYAKHITQQQMADLPKVRVRQAFPFESTGCDYAGPFTLKTNKGRNAKTSKGYLCLFVCMTTSAIHLELVTDMTTECFLAALRRFMSRRGKCSQIYSDNGRNFVGARRKLDEMHLQLYSDNHQKLVAETLSKEGIKWNFIPPYSPHWGGIWESGVRSVKLHLRRVVGQTILTFEQMHTLLAQIEAVINSRPLGAAPDTDIGYLSPAHFLIGRPTTMLPEGDLTEIKINRLDYWQHIQCMYQGFWRKWSREYLTSLQQRPKWANVTPNIEKDAIVLVKEDNTPPAGWITARVIDTFPGKDGLTRAVSLRTPHGIMTRPIVKIVGLPLC